MNNFEKIGEALKYIDAHLEESVRLEVLAEKFHFSPFYFHRLFSAVVGKSLAAYVRERRVLHACTLLSGTQKTILEIALECGFHSAQAFSRTFRSIQGIAPSEYRSQGYWPVILTADELIMKFTNRLRGGIFLNPNIISRGAMLIAGVCDDGSRTGEAWAAFEKLSDEKPLGNQLSGNGYEIRVSDGEKCKVFVGVCVSNRNIDAAYSLFELPAAKYASFDVYVANGYESENSAIDEWLSENEASYSEKLLDDGTHCCVEYYDERFHGNESDSIVEIWIPIQKK